VSSGEVADMTSDHLCIDEDVVFWVGRTGVWMKVIRG
jgi:hypothetical protein